MISYEPLWKCMEQKNITTYTLIHKYGFNSRTINNLKHNRGITIHTLERLCRILECTPNDIVCFEESNDQFINALREWKKEDK